MASLKLITLTKPNKQNRQVINLATAYSRASLQEEAKRKPHKARTTKIKRVLSQNKIKAFKAQVKQRQGLPPTVGRRRSPSPTRSQTSRSPMMSSILNKLTIKFKRLKKLRMKNWSKSSRLIFQLTILLEIHQDCLEGRHRWRNWNKTINRQLLIKLLVLTWKSTIASKA